MSLRRSLSEHELSQYVTRQLNNGLPDGRMVSIDELRGILPIVLERVEHCFSHVNNKYFFDGRQAVFNHLHGDQYAMFLYLAAHAAHKGNAANHLPIKLFLLNKMLHGIDAFYEVELPSVFLFVHPLGTVLGRARYQDFFIAYQRCGVGSNHDIYPDLGERVTLRPGSSVLGNCRVGRNCTLAAGSLLLDRDLPDDTVYIGNPRSFVTRPLAADLSIWRA